MINLKDVGEFSSEIQEDNNIDVPNSNKQIQKNNQYERNSVAVDSTIQLASLRQIPKNQRKQNVRNGLTTNNTIVMDEQYFQQDIESSQLKSSNKKEPINFESIKNYFPSFRWTYFFEFYLYHFLYFQGLGPLIIPILALRPGLPLVYNLLFLGHIQSIQQALLYVTCLIPYILFFNQMLPNIYPYGELVQLFLCMNVRILIIAIKYATFDSNQIHLIRTRKLNTEVVMSQFFLGDWIKQSNQIIYDEIHYVLRRYEIDECMFFIEFFLPLNKDTAEKLIQNSIDLSVYHQKGNFEPNPLATQVFGDECYFFGYGIIMNLVNLFQRKSIIQRRIVLTFLRLYILIRVFIPFLTRYAQDKPVYGENWIECIVIICIQLNLAVVYNSTLSMLIHGIFDLYRKEFFQIQMAFMLSPRKLRHFDENKALPTINIFQPIIIKGWMLIRKVCLEYGTKYFLRVQALYSFIVFIVLSCILVLILNLFGQLQLDQAFSIGLLMDASFIGCCVMTLLYFGSKINEMFKNHINLLQENKKIFVDLYRNRKYYFQPLFKSNNYIYNKAIMYFSRVAQGNLEEIAEILKELIEVYNENVCDLENDEVMHPFQILGVTINMGMAQSIGLGLLSALASIAFNKISQINN